MSSSRNEPSFPVETLGYYPGKTEISHRMFSTFKFSFILSGNGFYEIDNFRHTVKAPCVLMQWPGEMMHYGPDPMWEELFIIYNAATGKALADRKFFSRAKTWWPMNATPCFSRLLQDCGLCLDCLSDPFSADKLDAIAEMMILESLASRPMIALSREERIVKELELSMRRDFLSQSSFEEYAKKRGIHPATLRRYWERYFYEPPGRYLNALRMEEARRMLVETRKSVSEIAYALRFKDPLYFSRLFRKRFGCTASDYRVQFQTALTLR